MEIEILFTANEMNEQILRGKTVVVIDTLRATSTIVAALFNGAKAVEPISRIEEVQRRSKELKAKTFLLCGERDGVRVAGFDLGNSPIEYTPEKVSNKLILLSTTNGTLTIRKASNARNIFIGSLLNQAATMSMVEKLDQNLVLCCSGTKGHFSLEDYVTAGAMVSYLYNKGIKIHGDDRVVTARLLFERYQDNLIELMSCSQNGSRLQDIGNFYDIEFCSQRDIYDIVCYFDGQKICSGT